MTQTIYIERLRLVDNVWQWVPEPETFDVEADFTINDSDIDRELCRIGQLMARYGAVAAELSANLARKEEEVKYVAARCAAALRSQAEVSGAKTTVDKIKDDVVLSVEYQSALSTLHLLRAEAEKTEHWWRSISAKASALNSLTYWRGAEMRRA